ncbi:MAG TPA: T9SS type A sorting domain-containing protein, partial [Bacteroidota bacterium]|nr:T9SS type A sorting domain-containing protein [Bacteroidota bacterium]
SYLLDVKTEVQGNTYFFLKLYNANPLLSGSGEIIAIGKSGGQSSPVFSCGSGWTGDAPDASSSAINAGPVWLVVRFDMTGNADPCRTFMWVSPDPTTEPDTTTAVVKRFTGMKDGFNAIAIESGGDVAAGKPIQLVFDKISLATSYKDLSKVTGVKAAGINQPSDFRLSQNYPNPFNPSTVINYSLKTAGNVRLTVYNILGKEVAELVNGPVSAGMHEVTFNASGLASGMYFYQLRSGSLVQTMKMILMK